MYKLKIEKYLKRISSPNFKVIILRYPNIIGSSPSGKLGEKNNFISRIVPIFYKNIINKKQNILYYDQRDLTLRFPCGRHARQLLGHCRLGGINLAVDHHSSPAP